MAGRMIQGTRSVRQGDRASGAVLGSLDGGGGPRGAGESVGNLGSFYLSLGQYTKVIELHEQRLTVTKEVVDARGRGIRGEIWGSASGVSVSTPRRSGFTSST